MRTKRILLVIVSMLVVNISYSQVAIERSNPELRKVSFVDKGAVLIGAVGSYNKISTDNSEFFLLLENINLSASMFNLGADLAYAYRNNRLVGIRYRYNDLTGRIKGGEFDLGASNGIEMDIPEVGVTYTMSDYTIFHRNYYPLDKKGNVAFYIDSQLSYGDGDIYFEHDFSATPFLLHNKVSNYEISFNPGIAVYIMPFVSTNVGLGLGGFMFSNVKQYDEKGEYIGERIFSDFKFNIDVLSINFGINIHF